MSVARIKPFAFALVAASLCFAAPAMAEVKHRVREGDTFANLGRHFYGSAWKASYLRGRNSVFSGAPKIGSQLKVAKAWKYRIRRGDTLAQVSKKNLGSTDRYTLVMKINNKRNAGDLAVGEELLMPFHIRHVVQPGDSLSGISRLYYNSTRQTRQIQAYNGNMSSSLKPGQRITIPIWDPVTLKLSSRGPAPLFAAAQDADTKKSAESADDKGNADSATSANNGPDNAKKQGENDGPIASAADITKATALYDNGDYAAVQELLAPFVESLSGKKSTQITVLRLASFAEVAMDDPGNAMKLMAKWKSLAPNTVLDPRQVSPKIIHLFKRAKQ